MKKQYRFIDILFILGAAACLLLLTPWLDAPLLPRIAALVGRPAQPTWPARLHQVALLALLAGTVGWIALRWAVPYRAAIRRWLARLRDRLPEPAAPASRWRFGWFDGLILALFLLLGAVFYLERIQGPYPYVRLASDAGNIASFAAAIQNPGLFAGDALLSDPANLRSYSTLNIPLLNSLQPRAGNYALAFAWFIPPQTFITLAGFYCLGMVLFSGLATRRRLYALLLALVLALPYPINLLETWGLTPDPVTRFTFQAILPFLLALALLWGGRPARLPWPVVAAGLVACAGLLAFVHPVSTPAWTFAIWLGMLALLPAGWTLRRKALAMLGLGLVAAAALAPYALNYLGAGGQRAAGLNAAPYELSVYVIQRYFPANMLDVPAAVGEFLAITAASGLLPVSLALLALLIFFSFGPRAGLPGRGPDICPPQRLRLALLWLAGILFVSLLVPWAEHALERAWRIVPLETELVRGLRYVVFFMLLFSVWGLAELDRRLSAAFPRKIWRYAPAALALLLAVGWGFAADTSQVVPRRLAACLRQGRVLCVETSDDDRVIEAIGTLTSPGAPVLTTFANGGRLTFSLPIRYLALRPLVFTYKDRGQLITAHSAGIVQWYERLQAMDRLDNPALSAEERMQGYLALAREWGAAYLVADFKSQPAVLQEAGAETIYENQSYQLIRLR